LTDFDSVPPAGALCNVASFFVHFRAHLLAASHEDERWIHCTGSVSEEYFGFWALAGRLQLGPLRSTKNKSKLSEIIVEINDLRELPSARSTKTGPLASLIFTACR
jgi:hypothetical protein